MVKKLLLIETRSGLKEIKYWISEDKSRTFIYDYSPYYSLETARATLQVHLIDLKRNTLVV